MKTSKASVAGRDSPSRCVCLQEGVRKAAAVGRATRQARVGIPAAASDEAIDTGIRAFDLIRIYGSVLYRLSITCYQFSYVPVMHVRSPGLAEILRASFISTAEHFHVMFPMEYPCIHA
jgi:hypothetical protein